MPPDVLISNHMLTCKTFYLSMLELYLNIMSSSFLAFKDDEQLVIFLLLNFRNSSESES